MKSNDALKEDLILMAEASLRVWDKSKHPRITSSAKVMLTMIENREEPHQLIIDNRKQG